MSFLDLFAPLYRLIPSVKQPENQQPLNRRLLTSGLVLVLFFIMGTIPLIGLNASSGAQLGQLQMILASNIGTLISAGIGPIVLASIILQLLVGGGILGIDLTKQEDKAKFMAVQKLLAIVLCFFEAGAYSMTGMLQPSEGMFVWVVLQVAFGSIILMYLDEIVSKWGIGSGISLFIAGGVSQGVFWMMFNPFNISRELSFLGGQGLIFLFIQNIGANILDTINLYLLPIVFTIIVFLVVVFAEGIHVNIPITMGRKGTGGRFPVKFLYVSNIPVILAAALFANVRLWAELAKSIPFLGGFLQALSAIVIAPHSIRETIISQLISTNPGVLAMQTGSEIIQSLTSLQLIGLGGDLIHAFLYIFILVVVCVIFGKFWVEMAGQGPEAIAKQLESGGMYIPGFRRDPRVIIKVLERYIPPITILGAIFVALLAGLADLTGALGSGTGILLTVGIVYRFYEELAKAQLGEINPMLAKLLG